MEKNMENEMEIGVIQGFLGTIAEIMLLDSLYSHGIGYFK